MNLFVKLLTAAKWLGCMQSHVPCARSGSLHAPLEKPLTNSHSWVFVFLGFLAFVCGVV